MKFWTVQKRAILEIINRDKIYYSDFTKSDILQKNQDLNELYSMSLEAFNILNQTNVTGLIFSLAGSNNKVVFSFEDIYFFYDRINECKDAILSMWKNFNKEDYVILELDYNDKFNPMFIDINDFQFLMPPIYIMPPYTKEDISRIANDFCAGCIAPSIFPSYIIQAHLPYIKIENITNIYPMFNFRD